LHNGASATRHDLPLFALPCQNVVPIAESDPAELDAVIITAMALGGTYSACGAIREARQS
jgi:hypothetical protein